MPTIRRVYLYVTAFVSLEVILWGLTGLLREVAQRFTGGTVLGTIDLARYLSLLLVGSLVFGVHWWMAQRSVRQDAEERFSRSRALFLYGALLAMLIPVVQNVLAIVDRLLVSLLKAEDALVGGGQIWSDNLIAITVNLLAAAYFWRTLEHNWQTVSGRDDLGEYSIGPGDEFSETRRLSAVVWQVYGLLLFAGGVGLTLHFVLAPDMPRRSMAISNLANGLALLLVGAPLWFWLIRRQTQANQRTERGLVERSSVIWMVMTYVVALLAILGVLVTAGMVLSVLLTQLLGAGMVLGELLARLSDPLAVAIPLAGVGVYYGQRLKHTLNLRRPAQQTGENALEILKPVFSPEIRHAFMYLVALFGLGTLVWGVTNLSQFVITLLLTPNLVGAGELRLFLANALATTAVGLPVWLNAWRPLRQQAAQDGEEGDLARRSGVRRTYLYFVIFVSVIGMMLAAGALLYDLISTLLGDRAPDLVLGAANQVKNLIILGGLLAYHGLALRGDQRRLEQVLARRHARYPVLLLAPGETESEATGSALGAAVIAAIRRQTPSLPVAVHPYGQGVPDERLSAAQAVILPSELLARPTDAFRLWLQAFPGPRLIIPTASRDWWAGGTPNIATAARQVAHAVRHLSEGLPPPKATDTNPFQLLLYIFAGLFAAQLAILLFSLIIQFFW